MFELARRLLPSLNDGFRVIVSLSSPLRGSLARFYGTLMNVTGLLRVYSTCQLALLLAPRNGVHLSHGARGSSGYRETGPATWHRPGERIRRTVPRISRCTVCETANRSAQVQGEYSCIALSTISKM